MKSIAMLLCATGLAFSVAVAAAPAWSDGQLRGKYAFTESQHCLMTEGSFDDQLGPTSAQTELQNASLAGAYTFDGRGGLTVNETYLGINTPTFSGVSGVLVYAQQQAITGSGQYKFETDGTVTITLTININFLAGLGVNEGFTVSEGPVVLSGQPSPDGKTLLLSTTDPVVTTATSSHGGPPPTQSICNLSGVAVKLGSEPQ